MATSMCRFRVVGKILNFSIGKKCIYHQSLRTFTISSYNFTKVLNSQFFIKSATKSQVLVSKKEVLVNRLFSTEKKLSKEEITEKVLNVCRTFDKIPTDKLTLEAHFMNDLGLDSLDHVELIMNIEDDFNFEIPDGDAEKLLRPSDIVAYVEQKEATSKIV